MKTGRWYGPICWRDRFSFLDMLTPQQWTKLRIRCSLRTVRQLSFRDEICPAIEQREKFPGKQPRYRTRKTGPWKILHSCCVAFGCWQLSWCSMNVGRAHRHTEKRWCSRGFLQGSGRKQKMLPQFGACFVVAFLKSKDQKCQHESEYILYDMFCLVLI